MNIALIAHDNRKELMIQFCKAYKNELEKHTLVATATTGKLIAEHTGLPVKLLLSHEIVIVEELAVDRPHVD